MRFSLRRRVEGLTDAEIDDEIEQQGQHAQELLDELSDTLGKQAELYRGVKEERLRARGSTEEDRRDG